jgi:ribosomal protein S18 acetylase RimI-like enzyme
MTEATRTYLEMLTPDRLVPASCPDPDLRIERVHECPLSFFRYLYAAVGRDHHWVDRLGWTDEQIRAHVSRERESLFVAYLRGAPTGYFELEVNDDASIEIAYFGLLPEFKGRGFGKFLLTEACRRAWDAGARRIWLHTCTLDDRAALPNYVGRGFVPFKTETYQVSLPHDPETVTS